jgi:hypothetical protein
MVEAMGRDDRISAVLSTLTKGILGLPFSIVPSETGDGRRKDAAAKELKSCWFDIAPEPVLSELIRWWVMLGVAPGYLSWDTRSTSWKPRLRVLNPQFLRFDWLKWGFTLSTQDGELDVAPGDGSWVLACPNGARSWMRGSVRSLTIPWLARSYAVRDWARHNEVHGQPIRGCVVPMDASPADKNGFYNAIKNLSSETTIKLPVDDQTGRGFDLKLIEAQSDSHEAFDTLIAACNVAIAIELLGQNLTTEVNRGSFAASRVHERIRTDILQSYAESLSTIMREQVCKPWAQLNYGDPELAPWPKWDANPVADNRAEAQTLVSESQALLGLDAALERAGKEVDVIAVAERFGIPLRERTPGPRAGAAPAGEEPQDDDESEPKRADDMSDDEREDESLRKQEE